ncbi:MAG: response regulator transcription factor [Acidimicrobiia bacterium]|nr:response regulator transcription factor [Acidimicrobiia bacterium]MDH5520294.1 response regulator transcription factor [Acidimicrobiia bacterium]
MGQEPGPHLIVVDDHPLLALGLKTQLEQAGMAVDIVNPVGAINLVDEILAHEADLILVDLDMPFDGGGVGLTKELVEADQTVAVLTGSADRALWARCLENGAIALLTKDESLESLIDDIAKLVGGEPIRQHHRLTVISDYRERQAEQAVRLRGFDELSARETQVLSGLMIGLSPASLAERDYVSVQTVRTQIKNVLSKLGVNSQLAAVARAYESGWRPDDPRP